MMDHKWCEKTNKETRMGVDRLEVELKGYTTNLIKESIRVGSSSYFERRRGLKSFFDLDRWVIVIWRYSWNARGI